MGESAYIARPNTEIVIETSTRESAIVTGLKLLTGKLLSVFPSKRPVQMQTKVASIGIRGTGVYLESDPEQTYFCTCYGVADVAALADPQSKETVAVEHHVAPLQPRREQPAQHPQRPLHHPPDQLMLIETWWRKRRSSSRERLIRAAAHY